MHEVLVNRLGGLSLPWKSVVRLTDRPDMTLDVYRGHKTTMDLIFFPINYEINTLSWEATVSFPVFFLSTVSPFWICTHLIPILFT